jgi:ATP-dependent DNA helicase RecG
VLARTELLRILSRLGVDGPASRFESQELDFKQPAVAFKKTLSDLADASVCFANASGGTIVLGVNDKATTRPKALVGVERAYSVDVVRRAIFERTKPSITPFAEEHSEDGVRLLLIDVPAGVLVHSNTAGLATRRLGTDCLPFTPAEQREVLIARGQIDWSAEPSTVPPERLSAAEIERLRTLLRTAGKDELAALRDRPLLDALRLLASNGEATHAAVLLLASEETLLEVVPTFGYTYQYRPSPGSESISRFRRARPLLAATEELIDAVAARMRLYPLNVSAGVQIQLADYPQQAVREVVVNALIHRAYDVLGTVDVEQSPERLTITSPGGLVAGVTPANILTHPSTPRHRLLSDVVAMCQLAEKTGQGIDRAYREMLRAGKQPPEFEDSGLMVRAILTGGIGNDAFVRFVTDLPEELSADVEVLLALARLREVAALDAPALSDIIQRTPTEAQQVLARLADERYHILEATRSTARKPFPRYQLRPEPLAALGRALSYHRRVPDQIDAKVIEHVREYGFVTNKTLQRLFDIHVYAARDMLIDLRARGIVGKVGTARGGTGVKYAPGPNFPAESLPKRKSRRQGT